MPSTKLLSSSCFADVTASRFGISRVDKFHQKPFAFAIHTHPGSAKSITIYAAASNQQEFVAWMTALEAVTSNDDSGAPEISESADDVLV